MYPGLLYIVAGGAAIAGAKYLRDRHRKRAADRDDDDDDDGRGKRRRVGNNGGSDAPRGGGFGGFGFGGGDDDDDLGEPDDEPVVDLVPVERPVPPEHLARVGRVFCDTEDNTRWLIRDVFYEEDEDGVWRLKYVYYDFNAFGYAAPKDVCEHENTNVDELLGFARWLEGKPRVLRGAARKAARAAAKARADQSSLELQPRGGTRKKYGARIREGGRWKLVRTRAGERTIANGRPSYAGVRTVANGTAKRRLVSEGYVHAPKPRCEFTGVERRSCPGGCTERCGSHLGAAVLLSVLKGVTVQNSIFAEVEDDPAAFVAAYRVPSRGLCDYSGGQLGQLLKASLPPALGCTRVEAMLRRSTDRDLKFSYGHIIPKSETLARLRLLGKYPTFINGKPNAVIKEIYHPSVLQFEGLRANVLKGVAPLSDEHAVWYENRQLAYWTPEELAKPFEDRKARPFEETLAELERLCALGQCFLGFDKDAHPDFVY